MTVFFWWCSLTSQTSVETPPPGRSHATTSGLGYAQVASSHHSQTSMGFISVHFDSTSVISLLLSGWWRGVVVSALSAINEVNQHRARLLLGWVTVCGQVNRLGM